MKLVKKKVAELVNDPRNARAHDDNSITSIMASINEFKQQTPIVIDANGVVVKGNGTLEAFRRLGRTEIICIVTDLPEDKRKAYAIADNRTGDMSSWNQAVLAETLNEIQQADPAMLEATGFTAEQLADLLLEIKPPVASQEDDDALPAAPVNVISKPGTLWQLGTHRLLCGDARNPADVARLMAGAKADMLFTDPPYGVGYKGGVNFNKANKTKLDLGAKSNERPIKNDEKPTMYGEFLPVVLPFVDGPCYLWYADSYTFDVFKALKENGCELHGVIIWNKPNAKYGALNKNYKQRHEPCIYFKPKGVKNLRWNGPTNENTIWDIPRDPSNEFAPTQKPVALALRALQNHKVNTVLDTFGGSGSTMMAAEKAAVQAFTLELEPLQCDIMVKRWEIATNGKGQIIKE